MTVLTMEHYAFPQIRLNVVWEGFTDHLRSISLPEHMPEFKPSELDLLAAEQGIEEPTDLNAIWGCLEGAIDDEFLQALRQQREQH